MSLLTYSFHGFLMGRGKGFPAFHKIKHLAYMRERVMVHMFHHRVPLAFRNLTHIVAFLDFRFGLHFLNRVKFHSGLLSDK